jgi:excinuclease ABC subunit C
MRQVADFTFLVTETEVEALALEANLIKQHKPRYNVILRDDKNYPYLKLTVNEEWPRLEVVRKVRRDGSVYFGPYIPASSLRETLNFVKRHFHIRPCRYNLERPMRPCVQYQMGRCPAPCNRLVSRDEYLESVREVERFLKGEKKPLLKELESTMKRHSDALEFEEAARVRDRLQAVKMAFETQRVISPELGDLDVIGYYRDGSETVFQILFVRNGTLISTKDFYLKDTESIREGELFGHFIELFYSKDIILPPEIHVQVMPEGHHELSLWLSEKRGGKVYIKAPVRGKKAELVRMASENSELILQSRRGVATDKVTGRIRDRLGLRRAPVSIGAFDVSTTFGSHSVGAFVWWEDGEFRKEFYRHLKIKHVEGIDDYSMMREIITRTIKNMGKDLPDMIVIDGGKGHLDAAMGTLSEILGAGLEELDVVAVAKGPDRAFLTSGRMVSLDDSGPDALLLRKIRDEVHRFAIGFHRKLRGKGLLESRLEQIRGIGRKRRLALLRHFGSIEAIKRATPEEIAGIEGMNRKIAERVLSSL